MRTWNGAKWIRREKRLAIYLRDGLACVYCGTGVEDEDALTLDHLTPDSRGGSNGATNLVTCCSRCNSARQDRPWKRFASAAAEYRGVEAEDVIGFIQRTRRRRLDVRAAAALIEQRGGFTSAVKGRSS